MGMNLSMHAAELVTRKRRPLVSSFVLAQFLPVVVMRLASPSIGHLPFMYITDAIMGRAPHIK